VVVAAFCPTNPRFWSAGKLPGSNEAGAHVTSSVKAPATPHTDGSLTVRQFLLTRVSPLLNADSLQGPLGNSIVICRLEAFNINPYRKAEVLSVRRFPACVLSSDMDIK
jgi:hypothetical protein